MNLRTILNLVALALSIEGAELPKIASLKPGEKVYVSMTLSGYTITGADFVFTKEKVTITPRNMKSGELILTDEEKTRVDEYLKSVQHGQRKTRGGGGFLYEIRFVRNEQQVGTWSFSISDARKSSKPTVSLYELKDRIEALQKQKVEQPATKPADKVPAEGQPPTQPSKNDPR